MYDKISRTLWNTRIDIWIRFYKIMAALTFCMVIDNEVDGLSHVQAIEIKFPRSNRGVQQYVRIRIIRTMEHIRSCHKLNIIQTQAKLERSRLQKQGF